MSIITGNQALYELSKGSDVIYVASGYENNGDYLWSTPFATKNLTIHDFFSGSWVFKVVEK